MAEGEQVISDLFASSSSQKKKHLPREFQIRKAVLQGDLGLLREEMNLGGVVLDWQDQNKATYAHHAALRGHLEVCFLFFCFFFWFFLVLLCGGFVLFCFVFFVLLWIDIVVCFVCFFV